MENNKIKKLTLDDFRKKAIEKNKNRVMVKEIEVKGFGNIPFKRPSDNDSLEYLNAAAKSVKANKNGEILDSNISILAEAAKKIVYKCCDYLHDTELQDELEVKDPFDMSFKVFGLEKTMDIADKLTNNFDIQEVKEEIKN